MHYESDRIKDKTNKKLKQNWQSSSFNSKNNYNINYTKSDFNYVNFIKMFEFSFTDYYIFINHNIL